MHRLLIDIRGFMTRELYGAAGDEVVIVVERGNVLIVENLIGNRFPVNASQVTKEDVEIIPAPATPVNQVKKTHKAVKAKAKNTNTLF